MNKKITKIHLLLVCLTATTFCLSIHPLKPITPPGKDKIVTEFPEKQKSTVKFTENKGQLHDENYRSRPDVLYAGRAEGLNLFIRKSGVSYQLTRIDSYKDELNPKTKEKERHVDRMTVYRMDLNWLGANMHASQKTDLAVDGVSNYYLENCPEGVLNVKSYSGITLENIYNRIHLHYYEKDNLLKYDFIVAPGGDYKSIRLEVQGAEILEKEDGGILLRTELGDVEEGAPVVYQNGKELKSKWVIQDNVLSFDVENYNAAYELIIDPVTRVWGTYYGASAGDYGNFCTADAVGNVYMTGLCDEYNGGVVMSTVGPHQTAFAGLEDAFLAKFSPTGTRIWDTFYGGSGLERGFGCCLDGQGNVYMVGYTANTPFVIATPGAHQTANAGDYDAFLVKFNSNGMRQWATYYGGSIADMGYSCCTDLSGNVYISGTSNTSSGTGIATPGSHQTGFAGGNWDAFLAKFNSNGVRQWGTYYGGTLNDGGSSCVTDASGNIYLSGGTMSNDPNVIATPGSHQVLFGGIIDAFLVKFNTNGVRQWGTYYGGGGLEASDLSCAIDASGNIYLAGQTETIGGSIIATPGTHQDTYGGMRDGFLVKFNSNGVRQWGTYYGGNSAEDEIGCCVDASGNIYVFGRTYSSNGNTIATPGAYQTVFSGSSYAAFLMKFNPSGIRDWGTYVAPDSWARSATTHGTGTIYVTGYTVTTGPLATVGAFQTSFGGTADAFLMKLTDCPSTSSSQTVSTCNNYTWPVNSVTYTSSGTYVATLANSSGCDSLVILNLTINNSNSSETITSCNDFTWSVNNTTYTSSGVYTASLTNSWGCDSVVTLNLTINQGTSASINITECGSYTWAANNTTYTSSGTYSATLTNASGCDSTITLNLTIHNGTSGSVSVTECNSYTWPATNMTYTTSGVYTALLTNTSGCDSLVTLNLTIHDGTSESVSVTECNSYTWPLTNLNYTSSGVYTATLTNVSGCDSVITLQLNLVNSPDPTTSLNGTTIFSNATGVSYQWINCNNGNEVISGAVNQSYTPSVNGKYAVIIDNGSCNDTSDCVEINTLGLIENSFGENIQVYPNPVNQIVSIEFDQEEPFVSLSVYSVLGQQLKTAEYQHIAIIQFDMHNYAEGIYLLKMKNDSNKETVFILKKE